MMNIKKIGMAADHAGYELKEEIKKMLLEQGYEIVDYGTNSTESMDYPDVAHPLALAVEAKKVDYGIAMCGSANGISITLNKHQGIRSAICWNVELAKLARQHNDANVLAMPARFISEQEGKDIVNAFLNTEFEGGRHLKRVEKIPVK